MAPEPLPRPASTAIHESPAVAVHVHALSTVVRKLPPAGGAVCEPGLIVRSHADDGGIPVFPSHAAISESRPARRAPAYRRFIRRSIASGLRGVNRRYGRQRRGERDRTVNRRAGELSRVARAGRTRAAAGPAVVGQLRRLQNTAHTSARVRRREFTTNRSRYARSASSAAPRSPLSELAQRNA